MLEHECDVKNPLPGDLLFLCEAVFRTRNMFIINGVWSVFPVGDALAHRIFKDIKKCFKLSDNTKKNPPANRLKAFPPTWSDIDWCFSISSQVITCPLTRVQKWGFLFDRFAPHVVNLNQQVLSPDLSCRSCAIRRLGSPKCFQICQFWCKGVSDISLVPADRSTLAECGLGCRSQFAVLHKKSDSQVRCRHLGAFICEYIKWASLRKKKMFHSTQCWVPLNVGIRGTVVFVVKALLTQVCFCFWQRVQRAFPLHLCQKRHHSRWIFHLHQVVGLRFLHNCPRAFSHKLTSQTNF